MPKCNKEDEKGEANGGGGGGGNGEANGGGAGEGGSGAVYDATAGTAPVDPRFPNANQTNYCYSMYCDYFRCICLLGEEYEPCNFFKKVYTVICPNEWIDKFDDQRERGVFVGRISPNI